MMHEGEKSDSVVVAGKSPNKTGQPAAEAMERRTETKENTNQQSTRRAQNRESVSQALERIRKAAKQRKKERFTALFHHLTIDLLRLSFLALKRDAAPGADGVTWQDYEADLERKLADLHARVIGEGIGRNLPASVYTEVRRTATPACRGGARGQNRPESNRRRAEPDLRGRFPRVLIWVPAEGAASTTRWMR